MKLSTFLDANISTTVAARFFNFFGHKCVNYNGCKIFNFFGRKNVSINHTRGFQLFWTQTYPQLWLQGFSTFLDANVLTIMDARFSTFLDVNMSENNTYFGHIKQLFYIVHTVLKLTKYPLLCILE